MKTPLLTVCILAAGSAGLHPAAHADSPAPTTTQPPTPTHTHVVMSTGDQPVDRDALQRLLDTNTLPPAIAQQIAKALAETDGPVPALSVSTVNTDVHTHRSTLELDASDLTSIQDALEHEGLPAALAEKVQQAVRSHQNRSPQAAAAACAVHPVAPGSDGHAAHQSYTVDAKISIVGADGKEHPLSLQPGEVNAENIATVLRAQDVPEALVATLTPTILQALTEQQAVPDLPADLLEKPHAAPQAITEKLDLILNRLERLEERVESLHDVR